MLIVSCLNYWLFKLGFWLFGPVGVLGFNQDWLYALTGIFMENPNWWPW